MTSSKSRFSRGLLCAGVAALCGAALSGSAWSQSPVGQVTVAQAFNTADGLAPWSPVIEGTDGNLYGTTSAGGANNFGTVYQLTAAGTLNTLYSFTGGSDGATPYGGLVEGVDGNFYGTTNQRGSADSQGTIFKITPTGQLTTLYTFTSSTGALPIGGLVLGGDGNFYGTTYSGGTGHVGTVFKMTPAGTVTFLYSFTGGADGGFPKATLVVGPNGNFYGTTWRDGAGFGTVFSITLAGTLTTLYSFSGGADGAYPIGSVAVGNNGHLYGVAYQGGSSGDGTLYEIASGAATPTGAATVLHTFTGGSDGSSPWGGVLLGRDGNLYGTTQYGGASSDGTIFASSVSGVLSTLATFNGNTGANPVATLTEGSGGTFFGTTRSGGANNSGEVYQLTLPPAVIVASSANPSTYTERVTFTATVASPLGGSPTGTVTFTENGSPIAACASPVTVGGGTASCTTAALTAGNDTVLASYSGDNSFAPATGSLVQVVNRAPTAMTATPALLELSPTLGLELLNLSATLKNTYNQIPLANETIVFSAGGQVVCAAVTNSSGVASCSGLTPWLSSVLNLGYTATFAGDFNNLPSSVSASIIKL